jgi:hypothetical protein
MIGETGHLLVDQESHLLGIPISMALISVVSTYRLLFKALEFQVNCYAAVLTAQVEAKVVETQRMPLSSKLI